MFLPYSYCTAAVLLLWLVQRPADEAEKDLRSDRSEFGDAWDCQIPLYGAPRKCCGTMFISRLFSGTPCSACAVYVCTTRTSATVTTRNTGTAATMYSRVFPRAANAAACAGASATRAASASPAAGASGRSVTASSAFSGAVTDAGATLSSSPAVGVGRRVLRASSISAGRQPYSVAAVGGGAEGSWQPRAFPVQGQKAFSPLGGSTRPLSSTPDDRGKEEEEEAGGKEGAEGEESEAGGEEGEDVEALREELAKSEEKLKDTTDKALYLAAEMENVRAIAKRDAESARLYAVQKFAKQLLDVADNLERAIASAREAGSGEGGDTSHDVLLQGVEMTSQELAKVFASQGLEKFGEVSEKFDPHLHDAMFEYADPNLEPGTLGQVLKAGYKLHGRVIRAAQVGTVKAA